MINHNCSIAVIISIPWGGLQPLAPVLPLALLLVLLLALLLLALLLLALGVALLVIQPRLL